MSYDDRDLLIIELRSALRDALTFIDPATARDYSLWLSLLPTTYDPRRPTRSEQSLEGAAVNGLTPVGQEADYRNG